MSEKSISKEVEKYVLENPSIKDSLEKDLINYSKLARIIIKETELKNKDFDAALISLRRQQRKLEKKKSYQKKIKEVLHATTMDIKTNIYVCIIEKETPPEYVQGLQKIVKKARKTLNIVEGSETITLITEQEFKEEIGKRFRHRIIKENDNLISITLKSPASLEAVPGVVGYIYSLFASKGINIIETMSCWRDTILIIEKENLQSTVEILQF